VKLVLKAVGAEAVATPLITIAVSVPPEDEMLGRFCKD
jgi:hypothetical protein